MRWQLDESRSGETSCAERGMRMARAARRPSTRRPRESGPAGRPDAMCAGVAGVGCGDRRRGTSPTSGDFSFSSVIHTSRDILLIDY